MNLSIIIPAYNEQKRILKTLESLNNYLSRQDYEYEIIVVNDGSKDNTVKVVNEKVNEIKNLKIIDNEKNNGKGFVVKQGMMAATGKYRLFMDADNSTSIDHIEKAWPLFAEGYEIVIGSRDSKDAKGAIQAVSQPFLRILLGNIGNLIIQFFAIPGIWDTQCGFKVFTEKAVLSIFPKMKIDRWGFDIEALFIARISGYKKKIGIIPVNWINDSESKVGLSGYIQVFKELFQIRFYHLKGCYKDKI
jgi:dolichyl-phosphate beta-glucosyltransferase